MSKRKNKGSTKTDPKSSLGSTSTNETAEVVNSNNGGKNDPAWYARDQKLLLDSASLQWNRRLGDPLQMAYNSQSHNIVMPGLLTMRLRPSFGDMTNLNNPMNVSANALYSKVRYVNSGRKNYDAVDLMMYVISMAQIYSYIVYLKRIYNISFMYSQTNKYVGKALLASMNVNSDDIYNNLANYRYRLNAYINKVGSFAVPADITYFNRMVFLYNNLYLENPSASAKDQLYYFIPAGFMRYNVHETLGGFLEYMPFAEDTKTMHTVDSLFSYADQLLQHIWGDEDIGIICGDIIKTYQTNIIGIASISEEPVDPRTYQYDVLMQMKNATIIPDATTLFSTSWPDHRFDVYLASNSTGTPTYQGHEKLKPYNLYQDPATGRYIYVYPNQASTDKVSDNSITYNPYWANYAKLLDTENPNAGPIDVIEGTRLMVVGGLNQFTTTVRVAKEKPDALGTYVFKPCVALATGTEVAIESTVWYFGSKGDSVDVLHPISICCSWFGRKGTQDIDIGRMCRVMASHSTMKYAPIVYCEHVLSPEASTWISYNEQANPICPLDFVTVIQPSELQNIHEAAWLNLLYVNPIAKSIA